MTGTALLPARERLLSAARRASRRAAAFLAAVASLQFALAQPIDPPGLLALVDQGGMRLSLVAGHGEAPVARIDLAVPLLGRPFFSPDGRHAYTASRDGWITRWELPSLRRAESVRAGTELGGFALSGDGRWVLAGNASPPSLALFDSELRPVREYAAAPLDGLTRSAVSSVQDAPLRRSFIVCFDSLPQLWEISYDPAAEPIFDGLVHDYRMGEGIAKPGFLGARRTPLDTPARALALDGQQRVVLVAVDAGQPAARNTLQVIHLDVRRRIAEIPVEKLPTGPQVAFFMRAGRTFVALGGQPDGLAIVDAASWRLVQNVPAVANAPIVASHPAAAHLWTAAPTLRDRPATLQLVEKETAEIAVLRPQARAIASVSFSRDGHRAFVATEGPDLLVVYDTRSLSEIARLHVAGPAAAYAVGATVR